jgi:hypothetical protein
MPVTQVARMAGVGIIGSVYLAKYRIVRKAG